MNTTQTSLKQIGFWAAILIGVSALVAGMIWLVNLQKAAPAPGAQNISTEISSTDQTKGNKDAKVVLIEYSDFQCPACAAFAPVVDEIVKEFGNDMVFIYRHFPLPQHPNATPMAYAAEAAGVQGKFWEMSALIFKNQATWSTQTDVTSIVVELVRSLGLNVEKFTADFNSKELRNRIDATIVENQKVDISYTPTFFLNGKRIENPRSYEEFKAVITQAINESK